MNNAEYQETYKPCPYDPAHRILSHRFTTHLVKCRRNHPNAQKVPCKFNASHIVPKQELAFHMETCIDRNQIDNSVVVTDDNCQSFKINFSQDRRVNVNWDDDAPTSYNPQEYVKDKPILRRIDTASKAQRREFHEQERLRFQKIEHDNNKPKERENVRERPIRQPIVQQVAVPAEATAPTASERPTALSEILNRVAKRPHGSNVRFMKPA